MPTTELTVNFSTFCILVENVVFLVYVNPANQKLKDLLCFYGFSIMPFMAVSSGLLCCSLKSKCFVMWLIMSLSTIKN